MEIGLCADLHVGLNQQQVQSLQMLVLSTTELEAMLREEEMDNPFFELQESSVIEQQAAWLDSSRRPRTTLAAEDETLRQLAAPEDDALRNHLWAQIDWDAHTLDEQRLLQILLECLDEQGMLTDSAQELAKSTGYAVQMVERALEVLRGLEPAGVAAESVGHCLMLQLARQGEQDRAKLDAVRNCLEDLARGRFGVVAQKCGLQPAQARDLLRRVKLLDPNPTAAFQTQQSRYILPDVIAEQGEDGWTIEINDKWMGSVGLSDYYCRMAHQSDDPQLREYAVKKIAHAKFVISCVEKRRSTLERVVRCIVQKQEGYLTGQGTLQPFSIRDIAHQLDMHESTVGRAIRGKYLQCRRGCFALSRLLTAVAGESGSKTVGKAEVLERMRHMIQQEDKKNPMSDETICAVLTAQGVRISRRTVAKYREMMGIAGMFQRRVV